jgi:GNAT superfamily N-acetyltransferase
MAANRRSKILSSKTKELLAAGEGQTLDFKKIADGLSADDFVAFANSTGGQILVGVVEDNVDGAQVGMVRGCDISDGTILQITNKAISCLPPVSIEVYIENLGSKPILRIEIPKSVTKPHCTQKGVYCIRDGPRNRPLHPHELLRIFLDVEARAFTERFEAAADRITSELDQLESTLESSIENMSTQLGWAESQLGDTESNIRAILGIVHRVDGRSGKLAERMRSLFRQDKRSDPVAAREYKKLVADIVGVINEREDLIKTIAAGGQLTAQANASLSEDLTEDDFKRALNEAMQQVHDREVRKMYAIVCREPSKCRDEEIDDFCRLVAEGGEVGRGLKGRVKKALMLGFVVHGGVIVGTAALKEPAVSYRRKVFKSAHSNVEPGIVPYELGWVFLHPDHRGRGHMGELLNELSKFGEGENVFATTRTNNEAMKKALLKLGFTSNGGPYASRQHSEETLDLYLRSGGGSKL